jgi:hypothetical protein
VKGAIFSNKLISNILIAHYTLYSQANHAVKGAIVEALKCKESGEAKADPLTPPPGNPLLPPPPCYDNLPSRRRPCSALLYARACMHARVCTRMSLQRGP